MTFVVQRYRCSFVGGEGRLRSDIKINTFILYIAQLALTLRLIKKKINNTKY